jgi:DNA mismatch repair protein MutS
MTDTKNTPMMEQYLSIKEEYRDAILFYRMGDFYEMFHEDAKKAAPILGIALTSRNKNDSNPIAMCGIPVKAADNYIAKLVKNSCKVAICEQVEDAALATGLVKRKVVKVITPGMILNEGLLDKNSNNFLLALFNTANKAGISFLDISTGAFNITEVDTDNGKIPLYLIDEALRIDPSEILLPYYFKDDPNYKVVNNAFTNKTITYLEKHCFDLADAKQTLCDQFKTRSLEGFGCDLFSSGLSAAGAILSYIKDTQFQKTTHITKIIPYTFKDYLVIDNKSCRNLELLKNLQNQEKKGTLLDILDKTITAMGSRLLKTWIKYPLKAKNEIEQRFEAVRQAIDSTSLRESCQNQLKQIYDLERLSSKISMKNCNARDLTALKISLYKLPDLLGMLNNFSSSLLIGKDIKNLNTIVSELTDIARLIDTAIREDALPGLNEGGIINNGFNKDLDELLEISRNGKQWIAKAEAQEKESTKLSSLKIKYNKIFGYFIEVSKIQAQSVPETYIKKQTLVNSERFITEEIKIVESKILNSQEKRVALEYSIFCEIRDQITKKVSYILEIASFLARVDVLLCFAKIAQENNYTEPEINTNGTIAIREGRHPVVEKLVQGERYVPNSIIIDNDTNQILLITGPNMAGKSTILRQVALTSFMAQMGSFVPAEKASLCIIDKIFTRVGALDNLAQGQSTFMVEMEETANIVNNASENSLVILDEIGRGTSTYDGMSIAWAVAEYLHNLNGKGVKTLFATHYHELIKLEEILPRFKNFNIAVKEFNDNIVFLRQLIQGGTNKSYGIQVARLAGIPKKIIANAQNKLSNIEQNSKYNGNIALSSNNSQNNNSNNDSTAKQLDLFNNNGNKLIQMIDKIDISSITPIEALNLLNDLKQKIKL